MGKAARAVRHAPTELTLPCKRLEIPCSLLNYSLLHFVGSLRSGIDKSLFSQPLLADRALVARKKRTKMKARPCRYPCYRESVVDRPRAETHHREKAANAPPKDLLRFALRSKLGNSFDYSAP